MRQLMDLLSLCVFIIAALIEQEARFLFQFVCFKRAHREVRKRERRKQSPGALVVSLRL